LCISEECPWPAVTGYRLRLSNVVRALADLGEVDCFFVRNDGRERECCVAPSDGATVARLHVVHEQPPVRRWRRLVPWVRGPLPLGLLWRSWRRAPDALRAFVRGPYDVVWFGHIDAWVALGHLVDAPAVVDLDYLEHERLRHRGVARRRPHRSRALPARAPELVRRLTDPIDRRRWARLSRRVASEVAVVTVSSDLDRRRLGAPNVEVVPNGYERVAPEPDARPRPPAATRPVMVMVGVFGYEPNHDGAWWFAESVLPVVRARVPGAVLRLVGRVTPEIAALAELPGVELAGFVDDLDVELRAATVALAPIRSGGGTRLKVLEAFAYRVPVVSTTIGCEGVDVVDGEHLLVADDPSAFATACTRVLLEPETGERLAAAAHERFLSRYEWSGIRPLITALAARVAGRDRSAPEAREASG